MHINRKSEAGTAVCDSGACNHDGCRVAQADLAPHVSEETEEGAKGSSILVVGLSLYVTTVVMTIVPSIPLSNSKPCITMVKIEADDGSSAYHTIEPTLSNKKDVHPKMGPRVNENSEPLVVPLPTATAHTEQPYLSLPLPLPLPTEDVHDNHSSSPEGSSSFSTKTPVMAQLLRPFSGRAEQGPGLGELPSLSLAEWEKISSVHQNGTDTKNESTEKGEAASNTLPLPNESGKGPPSTTVEENSPEELSAAKNELESVEKGAASNTLPLPNESGKGPPSMIVKESSPEELSAASRSMINHPSFEGCVMKDLGTVNVQRTHFMCSLSDSFIREIQHSRSIESGIASASENLSHSNCKFPT